MLNSIWIKMRLYNSCDIVVLNSFLAQQMLKSPMLKFRRKFIGIAGSFYLCTNLIVILVKVMWMLWFKRVDEVPQYYMWSDFYFDLILSLCLVMMLFFQSSGEYQLVLCISQEGWRNQMEELHMWFFLEGLGKFNVQDWCSALQEKLSIATN